MSLVGFSNCLPVSFLDPVGISLWCPSLMSVVDFPFLTKANTCVSISQWAKFSFAERTALLFPVLLSVTLRHDFEMYSAVVFVV